MPGKEILETQVRLFAQCLMSLRLSPRPVVALVDGEARGGGLGIVCACDVVVATPRASFAMPELIFGLVPAVIWPFVVDRITPQRARRLALSGEAITAEQALAEGLIDEVCSADGLQSACSSWKRRLGRGSPESVAALKRLSLKAHMASLNEWLDQAIPLTIEYLTSPAALKRIRLFLAGRAPWDDLNGD